jgi:hypothetical protein
VYLAEERPAVRWSNLPSLILILSKDFYNMHVSIKYICLVIDMNIMPPTLCISSQLAGIFLFLNTNQNPRKKSTSTTTAITAKGKGKLDAHQVQILRQTAYAVPPVRILKRDAFFSIV